MLPAEDPGAFSYNADTWKAVLVQRQHEENRQCTEQ